MAWLLLLTILAYFFSGGSSRSSSGSGASLVPPPPNAGGPVFTTWLRLKRWAESRGLTVTSTTGGKHNPGSAHYRGLAIDVRTRDRTDAYIDAVIVQARQAGITVVDERKGPPRPGMVWSGPHLHLQAGPEWGL